MDKRHNEISDLGLAATLSALGFDIINLDRSNPKRVVFVFENTLELQTATDGFWDNSLKLSPNMVLEHYKRLKSRIYG